MLDLNKPYAVLADVRSNVTALKSVLADVESRGVDQGVVLGDTFAFGPDPKQVAQTLYDRRDRFVVLNGHPTSGFWSDGSQFNFRTQRAHEFLLRELKPRPFSSSRSKELWQWVINLSSSYAQEDKLFVCGTPSYPDCEFFPNSPYYGNMPDSVTKRMDDQFKNIKKICFYGIWSQPSVTINIYGMYENFKYSEQNASFNIGDELYACCPGGVGQPRDGITSSCYVVVKNNEVWWHRTDYNIKEVQERILKNEYLHDSLSDRLSLGR